ncbi:hypothetical protein [Mucilaginibacter auburnensis]|uniref:Uncharacterized protein n=1 Tax=Mucilaginibacter auburnensis TaxID=1457233 RepID=A0A2H9VTG9_9SPHI|nr:hypothetical protein [Mucilaginibacter auburnensis]PJJ84108.1 hypothetical protein CLV57_1112 [Mucilaginibacter auburnensis]
MKKILALLFVVLVFAGCNDKRVELVTINASAYVDDAKAIANFAILTPTETGVFSNDGALDRYFATIQQNTKIGVTDYSTQVLPGEYVLVIQLKDGNPGVLYRTYTYNFITTRGPSAKFNYTMQFRSGKAEFYQPWADRK